MRIATDGGSVMTGRRNRLAAKPLRVLSNKMISLVRIV